MIYKKHFFRIFIQFTFVKKYWSVIIHSLFEIHWFFIALFNKIKSLYINIILKFPEIKIFIGLTNDNYSQLYDENNELKIIGIDGTTTNSINESKLRTTLNLIIYDCNNLVPVDICTNYGDYFKNNKNNDSNKNHEITMLKEYINNHDCKNYILTLDRLYSAYTVLNFLEERNIKYIIRCKSNLVMLNADFCPDDYPSENFAFYKNKDFRILRRLYDTTMEVGSKREKRRTLDIKSEYIIATNVSSTISDDKIFDMYKLRWNAETFIGAIKSNTNFGLSRSSSDDRIEKTKYIDLLIATLNRIFVTVLGYNDYIINIGTPKYEPKINKRKLPKIDKRFNKNKKIIDEYKQTEDVSVKINFSKMIRGFYDTVVDKLVVGELTSELLTDYSHTSLNVTKNGKNRRFKRESILPYTKWYVKKYNKMKENYKIVTAILDNKIDELNKNLKTKALSIKDQILKIYEHI